MAGLADVSVDLTSRLVALLFLDRQRCDRRGFAGFARPGHALEQSRNPRAEGVRPGGQRQQLDRFAAQSHGPCTSATTRAPRRHDEVFRLRVRVCAARTGSPAGTRRTRQSGRRRSTPSSNRRTRHWRAKPRHFGTSQQRGSLPARPATVGDPSEQGLSGSVLCASHDRRREHGDDGFPIRRLGPVGLQHPRDHSRFAAPQPAQDGVDSERIVAVPFEQIAPRLSRAAQAASRRARRPAGTARPSPDRPAASAPQPV